MENIYKAYTKEINGKVFYFVKKFSSFPEIEDCPSILEEMGMHTNFYKACHIAQINDEVALNTLMNDLNIARDSARVIRLPKAKPIAHSLFRNTHNAFFKFRWATSS